jgi:hypothetical protein
VHARLRDRRRTRRSSSSPEPGWERCSAPGVATLPAPISTPPRGNVPQQSAAMGGGGAGVSARGATLRYMRATRGRGMSVLGGHTVGAIPSTSLASASSGPAQTALRPDAPPTRGMPCSRNAAVSNQPGIPDQRLGANWVPELQRKAGSRRQPPARRRRRCGRYTRIKWPKGALRVCSPCRRVDGSGPTAFGRPRFRGS